MKKKLKNKLYIENKGQYNVLFYIYIKRQKIFGETLISKKSSLVIDNYVSFKIQGQIKNAIFIFEH